jgi:plasmid stability protein
MPRGDYPSTKQDQYMVRFPQGMRDQLKDAAAKHGRSMNAEIVHRLAFSFDFEMRQFLDRPAAQNQGHVEQDWLDLTSQGYEPDPQNDDTQALAVKSVVASLAAKLDEISEQLSELRKEKEALTNEVVDMYNQDAERRDRGDGN